MLVAVAVSPAHVVEEAGVRVSTSIRASVYAYEVRNQTDRAICAFAVPYSDGYDFTAPAGWQVASTDGLFRAWTTEPFRAIRQGESARFSFRVTSHGAVLGYVPLSVEWASGESLTLPGAWGACAQPASYGVFIAAVVLALGFVHALVLARRERPGRSAATAL
jgi:hypothetical protein